MSGTKRRSANPVVDVSQIYDQQPASEKQVLDIVETLDFAASMAEELAVLVKRLDQQTAGDQLLFASANLRTVLGMELKRRASENFIAGPSRTQ